MPLTLRIILYASILFIGGCYTQNSSDLSFDGESAWSFLVYQVELGPRPVGSLAHAQTAQWLADSMKDFGWEVEIQAETFRGQKIKNIIAKRGSGKPWVILGAHYDTRLWADQDPDLQNYYTPIIGANDGASGVSILMELARILPDNPKGEIWIVFFDAEDNGNIPDWDWILGSTLFVELLESKPDMAIILDMVGDSDLDIYFEGSSNLELSQSIWSIADDLGFSNYFIPRVKYRIIDDHTPFLRVGIPAIDIIDFDYPYWHTISDTLDNVSATSLQIVGDTMLAWILETLFP